MVQVVLKNRISMFKRNPKGSKNNPSIPPLVKGGKGGFEKVFSNNKGVSLIEVMIALVVLLLVFVGLLQAALLSIDFNMRNIIRDEGVKVAAERIEEARSLPFDNVITDAADNPVNLPACGRAPVSDAGPYPIRVDRNFRNIQQFPFGTNRTVLDLDADTKQIQVLVRWEYKNECYTHRVTTLRRR